MYRPVMTPPRVIPERLSSTYVTYLAAVAGPDADPTIDYGDEPCEECGEVLGCAISCGLWGPPVPRERASAASEDSHYERIRLELTASWSER